MMAFLGVALVIAASVLLLLWAAILEVRDGTRASQGKPEEWAYKESIPVVMAFLVALAALVAVWWSYA